MSMFPRAVLFLLACVAISTSALASDPLPTTESKENRKFETQGAINATEFFRWLYDRRILGDGFVGTGYETVLHDNVADKYLNVNIETRLYSRRADRLAEKGGLAKVAADEIVGLRQQLSTLETCLKEHNNDTYTCGGTSPDEYRKRIAQIERNPYSAKDAGGARYDEVWDDILFLPVETHLRVRLDGEQKNNLRDLRVGLLRFMNDNGFNLQLLSYLLKNNDLGLGRMDALEVLQLGINEAIFVEGVDSVEVIFKGTASVGYAGMSLPGAVIPTAASHAGLTVDGQTAGWYATAGGSVGVRIARKVVVDFFGGVEYISGGRDKDKAGVAADISASYLNTFYGVGARYSPLDWLSVHGYVRFDQYKVSAEMNATKTDTAPEGPKGTASEIRNSTSVGVDVEARW